MNYKIKNSISGPCKFLFHKFLPIRSAICFLVSFNFNACQVIRICKLHFLTFSMSLQNNDNHLGIGGGGG